MKNKKPQPEQKQFIVRKYIMASSATEAILKDRKQSVDDVWINTDWKKENTVERAPAIGFNLDTNEND